MIWWREGRGGYTIVKESWVDVVGGLAVEVG